MGPLYKFGWFDFAYSLQLAGLIGFCFGLLLERAGFGNPKKLVAVFYLRDFAVLKVMFTAIVVCIVGLLYFSVFDWIDLGKVYLLPTFLWPQMVGGFILGVGFVVGGYCPTTSVVATVSGRLDGLIFVGGMILGSLIFAEFFPLLEGFYNAGSMGAIRLSDVLGLQSGLIALLICLMAVCAYWFVEKVETWFGDPDVLPGGSRKAKRWWAALLVLLGLLLAILNPDEIASKRPESAVTPPLSAQKTKQAPPKPKAPAIEFKIGQDEGC
jgi:uncharacterized membrane protein YedE/YeeE